MIRTIISKYCWVNKVYLKSILTEAVLPRQKWTMNEPFSFNVIHIFNSYLWDAESMLRVIVIGNEMQKAWIHLFFTSK